jgi:hypothetical protein
VEADEFFMEVEKKLAERAADDGVVELAELIAEREKESQVAAQPGGAGAVGSETASVNVETDKEEKRPTPQVEEALRVLGDLVLLGR